MIANHVLHNHDHARYTTGSVRISTSEALTRVSVFYPSRPTCDSFISPSPGILINLYSAVRLRSAVAHDSTNHFNLSIEVGLAVKAPPVADSILIHSIKATMFSQLLNVIR